MGLTVVGLGLLDISIWWVVLNAFVKDKKHQQAQEVYQKHFGPLKRQNAGADGRWNWVDDPWPWEEV